MMDCQLSACASVLRLLEIEEAVPVINIDREMTAH